MNFKTFEEYLQKLERVQTDGQIDRQTESTKHFLTLLDSVKKRTFLPCHYSIIEERQDN